MNNNSISSSNYLWFPKIGSNPESTCRIFCFPYAGGSILTYNKWSRSIAKNIEVCAIQLPGRANRMNESAFKRVDALVEVLSEKFLSCTDKPFALFGHSMGGILCYELGQKLIKEAGIYPIHLFVSSRSAPHIKIRDKITYDLPQHEFIKELFKLNGTQKEVLENTELMELLLPLLRADFELVETYNYKDQKPLSCPITVFTGTDDDEVSIEDMQGWKFHTLSKFELNVVKGDHFFINKNEDLLTSIISEALASF